MRCVFSLCGRSHLCAYVRDVSAHTLSLCALHVHMCLRWGQQKCYHKLVGHSSASNQKGASGCESVPTGKPTAVVLALQHQCQDRKLTVAFGENVSESSEENAPEMRIRGAKSPSEEKKKREMK